MSKCVVLTSTSVLLLCCLLLECLLSVCCRNTLVPLLCLLPLVGPSVYLLLRPKTYGGSSNSSQE